MTHRNLIGGEWIEGEADAVIDINPSNTDDVVGEYAPRFDAERWTTRLPRHARPSPPGRARRRSVRARHPRQGRRRDSRPAQASSADCWRARRARRWPRRPARSVRAAQIFKFFAGEALRVPGERVARVRPGIEVMITREPVGVVGLITPWNFPIAIPAWKIAPALAYGNSVVLKPAELVPGSAWALADILHRAGLPARRAQPRHRARLGRRRS